MPSLDHDRSAVGLLRHLARRRASPPLHSARLAFARVGADARIETDARVRISRRDPTTGMIAAEEVRHASAAIGRAVRDVLTEERRPLIIGGDCTVLLGVFLGLPRGIGLWFVDGHADFLDGGTSPTGEAAAMDLAILTGHGPPRLLGSAGILVDPTSVALLGHCPDHLSPDGASENARIDPAIRALTAPEIRERGAGAVGQEVAASNLGQQTWLHIDLR